MNYRVRLLTPANESIFRPVRLDALRLHPTAFGGTYEEERSVPPATRTERLLSPPSMMFGGFTDNDELVGTAGLRLETRDKIGHKATLFAVYVDAAHRGTGLARMLVEAAVAQARSLERRVMYLTVTEGNHAARRLYASLGFRRYGVEPRALRIDGQFLDRELMALDLD